MMRTRRPARAGSDRPSADTTPAVTEPAKPCGLPIATTSWPTRERLGVAERRPRARSAAVGAQHGEVGERSAPTIAKRELAPVDEQRAAAAARAGDDVRRGEQEAVGGQDDGRCRRRRACARRGPRRVTRRLATDGPTRSATVDDVARVGVEGLGVAGASVRHAASSAANVTSSSRSSVAAHEVEGERPLGDAPSSAA